jgi:GxxExxY protein
MTKTNNDPLSDRVIGGAIEVHRYLGPGLLESSYEQCLCFELAQRGVAYARQVPLPIVFKGHRLDCGYRLDIVVEERMIVEVKSVEQLTRVHAAQLLTYLKLSGMRVGLLLNFNVVMMRHGLRRFVQTASAASAVNPTQANPSHRRPPAPPHA